MPATFELAPEVERIAGEIIASEIEHEHLRQARILYLFRRGAWTSKGKTVYGKAKKVTGELAFVAQQLLARQIGEQIEKGEPPAFTGSSRPLQYDFVLEINRETWPNLTDLQRKAIIDHELCHCLIDTKGKTSITGHDVEDFGSVIRRYGLYMQDLKAFGKAVRQAPDQMTLDDLDDYRSDTSGHSVTLTAGGRSVTVDGETFHRAASHSPVPAKEDDADLDEALAEFEEDGPLYPRHYCTRCRKQISDLETLSHDGALFHVPAKGECDGPVVRLEPGEPEPTAADQAAAS